MIFIFNELSMTVLAQAIKLEVMYGTMNGISFKVDELMKQKNGNVTNYLSELIKCLMGF